MVDEIERRPFTTQLEIIDAQELALRWKLPVTWVREQTRTRSSDPIPHLKLGRYRRFEFGSPALADWLNRRRSGVGSHKRDAA